MQPKGRVVELFPAMDPPDTHSDSFFLGPLPGIYISPPVLALFLFGASIELRLFWATNLEIAYLIGNNPRSTM